MVVVEAFIVKVVCCRFQFCGTVFYDRMTSLAIGMMQENDMGFWAFTMRCMHQMDFYSMPKFDCRVSHASPSAGSFDISFL